MIMQTGAPLDQHGGVTQRDPEPTADAAPRNLPYIKHKNGLANPHRTAALPRQERPPQAEWSPQQEPIESIIRPATTFAQRNEAQHSVPPPLVFPSLPQMNGLRQPQQVSAYGNDPSSNISGQRQVFHSPTPTSYGFSYCYPRPYVSHQDLIYVQLPPEQTFTPQFYHRRKWFGKSRAQRRPTPSRQHRRSQTIHNVVVDLTGADQRPTSPPLTGERRQLDLDSDTASPPSKRVRTGPQTAACNSPAQQTTITTTSQLPRLCTLAANEPCDKEQSRTDDIDRGSSDLLALMEVDCKTELDIEMLAGDHYEGSCDGAEADDLEDSGYNPANPAV